MVWPYCCVGWCDTVNVSCLVSKVDFNCIVQHSLYHDMDIGTVRHCALVSCTPSHSVGLFFWCALFWCCVWLGAPFTISLIELYFIMIFITIVLIIIGIFMANFYFWNYIFRLFVTNGSGSANAQLPGCFRLRTASLNIGLNMLPSSSFMSYLHSLLGYTTAEL